MENVSLFTKPVTSKPGDEPSRLALPTSIVYVLAVTDSAGALLTVIEPSVYVMSYQSASTPLGTVPTAADGTTEYGEPDTPADAPSPEVVSVTEPTASLPMSPMAVKSLDPLGVSVPPYVLVNDVAVIVSGALVSV
ncbi:unannotated protein [freshwater metagenome]|uniref:Unannotated protein n=1 Tax=freshwater metagenome TaxID=449393 RepID=A0A6J7JXP7_9ZZZZ